MSAAVDLRGGKGGEAAERRREESE